MKRVFKFTGSLVFWLGVWELISLLVGSPLLLPGPVKVVSRLCELAGSSAMWLAAAATLGRVILGVSLGMALGLALAVLTSLSGLARALFSPLLTAIKSTPVVSFIILLLIWLGRNFVPVVIAALMVLPVVWANVSAGISGADPLLLELAKVYRLRPGTVLSRIYVPSVLPQFLAACRSALGLAWKAGVTAEVLTVPARSIGRMLYESKQYMETTDMFAWTLLVVICSLIIEKLLTAAFAALGGAAGEEAAQ